MRLKLLAPIENARKIRSRRNICKPEPRRDIYPMKYLRLPNTFPRISFIVRKILFKLDLYQNKGDFEKKLIQENINNEISVLCVTIKYTLQLQFTIPNGFYCFRGLPPLFFFADGSASSYLCWALLRGFPPLDFFLGASASCSLPWAASNASLPASLLFASGLHFFDLLFRTCVKSLPICFFLCTELESDQIPLEEATSIYSNVVQGLKKGGGGILHLL